jgi:hypothetical protein
MAQVVMLPVIVIYAERHYAECRYAEWFGASFGSSMKIDVAKLRADTFKRSLLNEYHISKVYRRFWHESIHLKKKPFHSKQSIYH